MKKFFFLPVVLLVITLAGCFKDDCKTVERIYKPVYITLKEFRETQIKAEAAKPVNVPGKIYLYKNYIFLNEPGSGIHVIDNSDPSNPKNISFITIPGNVDLAVKDDYLYADSYADLIVFDISNPANAVAKDFKTNVFKSQGYILYNATSNNPEEILIPVDYVLVDTLVDCHTYSNIVYADFYSARNSSQVYLAAMPSKTGIGGSTARFTVLNNYLYTVDYNTLYSFDIKNAADPKLVHNETISVIGGFVETIYPFQNNLFIGASNGVFIYSVAAAAAPAYVGEFGHFVACDPVIADNENAFVTLRSGSSCQGFTNELQILDIATDITNPTLLKTYNLTNPRGLSKDGDLLFICDGPDGLKVYDASDINDLSLKQTISDFEANDVIAFNKLALVTSSQGLYQYDYSNASDLKLLSKISVGQ